MTTLKFAPLAEADIDDIHEFISYDDPDIADRFLRELMGVLGMLAENPAAGKQRPDLDKSLRFFPYRKYCIFYYPIEDGAEISRVLHSARDTESIFD